MMGRDKDRELREELQSHLDMAARDRIERGEGAQAAADAARREFGSVALVHEVTRDTWGWRWLERCVQDLTYGLRLVRRAPAFAGVAIVSLAVGIGAATAIFQVINALSMSALPVARPEELVEITLVDAGGSRGSRAMWKPALSNPIWEAVRDRQQAFSGVFAWGLGSFNLTAGGEARPAQALWASGGLFEVLGVRPALGRLLTPADDVRGCEPRAVLSHPFWLREYGGEPSVVGRTITLNSGLAEIVGVAPPGFFGLEVGRSFDVAIPICAEPALAATSGGGPPAGRLDSGTDWWLIMMGRLRPGVTIEQATAQLGAISSGVFRATLEPNYPPASVPAYLAMQLHALPASTGLSRLREDYEAPLWILLSLALVVLVIACANVANLMLARATARGREIAVRLSLGASRARVIRQLITESLVLAAVGAAGGVVLARMIAPALVRFVDANQGALFLNLTFDWRVIAFASAIAAATTVFFGLAPAIRATTGGARDALTVAGRGQTVGRQHASLRRGLIVAQVALCFVLIVTALLFTATMKNLGTVDPGFTPEGILLTAADFRNVPLPAERRVAYRQEIVERLRALPGVEGAAATLLIPLSGARWANAVTVQTPAGPVTESVLFNRVSEGYFSTVRTPLLAGRDFDGRDTLTAPPVAIVNEAFVRSRFGSGEALGRTFRVQRTPTSPETDYVVVGIAGDSKYTSVRSPVAPAAFLPMSQESLPGQIALIATRSGDPGALTPVVAQAMRQVDARIVVTFRQLSTEIDRTLVRERVIATLSIAFGGIAAFLAMVGLYGVIAYTITLRTNEIGVRMALGARAIDVLGMILREAAVLVVIGLGAGLLLATAVGRVSSSLLFGVGAYDPAVFATAIALLAGIALIASLIPARAAARIQPTVALRAE